MNKAALVFVLGLFVMIMCVSCDKDSDKPVVIEGLTLENFPRMDGSTSTDPLVKLAACKLLGYNYKWKQESADITWRLSTDLPTKFVEQNLKSSQTHNAFVNLIDDKADMIFSARTMSPDEKAYASEAGVSLIETPIALDALIFIEHPSNKTESLTHEQIRDIYSGKIKNWKEVGGDNEPMIPFIRNKNSGSQELMETLVFDGNPIPEEFLEDMEEFQTVIAMIPVFTYVSGRTGGLGYTIYYYKENMIRDQMHVNTLAVNGIHPNKKTIKSREYPYTAEVYLIIRSDLDKSSMAYKVYELMQTKAGQQIINESGYVAIE